MKKSNKILAVIMALVMMITAVPMMTAMAGDEHVHTYKVAEKVDATCTAEGYVKYSCLGCADDVVVTLEKVDHKLIGTIKKNDAVTHKQTCDVCGTVYSEHNFVDVKVTKEATCTEAGTKEVKCADCGYEAVQVISAKGHTITSVAANDITATTHKGVCTVCEMTVTVPHTWGDGVVTKAPKCLTPGEMTYACTVCKKETKVNTETAMEELVGVAVKAEDWEKIMPTHSFGKWTSVDDDTHKSECACGFSKTADHNFVVVEGAKSLCNDSVALTITCEDCNYKLETKAAEHEFEDVAKYDKDNHKQTCKNCGLTVTAAHNWEDVKVTKAATCKEAGSKDVKCKDCGETATVAIPKLEEHTWDKGEVTKEANCGEKGEKTFKCTVCEATKTEEIATVGEHKWGKWEVTVIATPLTKGTKTRTCSVCGAKESEKFEYEEETDEFLTGDVNNDDKVTASDARLVLQNVAGLREFTEAETKAADVNEDGKISAVDARMILQIVAGIIK